jgi:Polysaccharide deacetylase
MIRFIRNAETPGYLQYKVGAIKDLGAAAEATLIAAGDAVAFTEPGQLYPAPKVLVPAGGSYDPDTPGFSDAEVLGAKALVSAPWMPPSLPRGTAYLKAPGRIAVDPATILSTGWTKGGNGGGVGTMSNSTDRYWPETVTGIRMTNTHTTGNLITWEKDLPAPITGFLDDAGAAAAPSFMWPVKFDDFSRFTSFTLRLSMGDSTFTNYFQFLWNLGSGGAGRLKQSGWQMLFADGADFTTFGSPTWDMSIYKVQIRWNVAGASGSAIDWDSMYFNRRAKAKILLYFDRCYATHYTVARPLLAAYGLKATFAITPNELGTSGTYMTVAQVKQLLADGHAICLRPEVGFGSQSVDLCVSRTRETQQYLIDTFGAEYPTQVARGIRHIVYNQGQYWPGSGGTTNAIGDRTVVDRLRAELGILSGRTTETTGNPDSMALASKSEIQIYPTNLMTHGIIGADSTNTVATLIARKDQAITRQTAVAYFLHTLIDTNTGAQRPEDYNQFLASVATSQAAGLIDAVTVPDFVDGL